MWLSPTTTTVTSLLLLRRFNKSISSKSCRATALIHQTSLFTTTTFNSSSSSKYGGGGTFIFQQQQQANNLHTTTFNSSFSSFSKFGGGGTFILPHQQQSANNLHTTTSSSSSSKFGTIILQTNEPSVDYYHGIEIKKDDIKMFMLSSGSEEEEEDKDDDDQKKKKRVFKLDEDLGFSALYKDFNLQDSIRMVGSHNGIICLHDPELRFPRNDLEVRFPMRDVYLWNPATRHFRILPESIHIEEQMAYEVVTFKDFVGFGFDFETQDYKVLRISPFVPRSYRGYEDGCGCRVQVYSLSTDSWRVLDGIDSLPLSPTQDLFGNRQGTYLKGSCFFVGSKPINRYGIRDLTLWSFDFTKECFTYMDLPEAYCHKLVLSSSSSSHTSDFFDDIVASPGLDDIRADEPVVFRTSRAEEPIVYRTPRLDFTGGYVFTTPRIDSKGVYWYYKLWVLNEQRGSGSGREVKYEPKWWTQLHEFRIETESKHPPYSDPRCVSKDEEFALISTTLTDDNGRKKLMLFNLVTKEAVKDFTIGDRDCGAAYVYKESQVSIMGAGNALLRWQLPIHGATYKLNWYAPFIDPRLPVGIGLCLTSDTGGCIRVRSLREFDLDPEEVEASAMFYAIEWARELDLSPIIIESDSKNMVSFFMEDNDDHNLLTYWRSEDSHLFLKDAKLLLKSSENNSISFQYCSRSSNYVAEIASKLSTDKWTTWCCKDWTAKFPGEVVMSLSKDLGLIVR